MEIREPIIVMNKSMIMIVAKAIHTSYINKILSLPVVGVPCKHEVTHVSSWSGSMKSSQMDKYKENRS